MAVADSVADVRNVPGWENGVDISMADGLRYGNAVLRGQATTLRDLYTWLPIAPAVNSADFRTLMPELSSRVFAELLQTGFRFYPAAA